MLRSLGAAPLSALAGFRHSWSVLPQIARYRFRAITMLSKVLPGVTSTVSRRPVATKPAEA